MDEYPLVSVLIATYNRPHLLGRAISSVLKQTYSHFEIIVVDDASPQPAQSAAESFQDSRIRYIRNERNLKVAGTTNIAAEAANGDYLAILNDDDEWVDDSKLMAQMQILLADTDQKIGVVCTGLLYVDEETRKEGRQVIPGRLDELNEAMLIYNTVSSTTALIRKQVWQALAGYDYDIPRDVDGDFFRRVLEAGYVIEAIPDIMAVAYSGRSDRMSAFQTKEQAMSHLESYRHRLKAHASTFARFPNAKARVLGGIANRHLTIWELSAEWSHFWWAWYYFFYIFLVSFRSFRQSAVPFLFRFKGLQKIYFALPEWMRTMYRNVFSTKQNHQ